MATWGWIIVAIAVLAVAAAGVVAWQATRRRRLQRTFGQEYERTVADAPSRREAESELQRRRKERDELDIRPLSPRACERYAREWESVQARFVDEPAGAVRDADRLVQQVMEERGYPMEDFERRAALVSVDHPAVVENYRAAHRAYLDYDRGRSGTEDLRRAMVHYRSLFDDLLETDETAGRRSSTTEEVR